MKGTKSGLSRSFSGLTMEDLKILQGVDPSLKAVREGCRKWANGVSFVIKERILHCTVEPMGEEEGVI